MTRVSDTSAFAAQVAEGGALPFLALALMRAHEVEELLRDTRRALGDRPWGVGILGFVPSELRREQLAVIREHRPSFALIAGGRPDQARSLEQDGIPTYLHVPSPGLLELFAADGARRFVFEGRECGGHVGPYTSFVLWNTMIEKLLDILPPSDLAHCHVLFAGGIHDALSARMVATMAAPLAEHGAKIGVLLGTAYLFTKEAVATGAIQESFQEEAMRCTRTVLLESGPGHATRCAETPFAGVFTREKQRLLADSASPDETRGTLEELNLGRLRIASKGIRRHPKYGHDPDAPRFEMVSAEVQHAEGMYMIGQAATLRHSACTIAELHRDVSIGGSEQVSDLPEPALGSISDLPTAKPCQVAIIGMACLLPKAPDLTTYWENVLSKVDAIREIPPDRWDYRPYFDPDPEAPDKIYSMYGGFLDDVPFDPMRYGMPPNSLASIEPVHMLTLEVVRAALEDAGYASRPFPRERTAVILGAGGGVADLGIAYAVRSALPSLIEDVPPELLSRLPEWTEDSFAGILANVAAGRVANRFDLGGVNFTVDAACASSLAAVYHATRELESGTSDVVIVGGVDTVQNPFGYLCFSKTHALSPSGRCKPFDAAADGIAISEGLAVLILKRLSDAERDGDRIYAVIQGIAGSSDGMGKGLTAPRPEGQVRALERALAKANFSPATVGLIEAHGTGTVAGDQSEVESLKRVFDAATAVRQGCAIGSVKSMIGHTKCTAGVAGLMKAALALHYKVLPPTLHVEQPNPKAGFPDSPFYVNTESRPWIQGKDLPPRRAGVSAFGFGGTNFHAVLEEHTGSVIESVPQSTAQRWPSELLLWSGDSREELIASIEPLRSALADGATPGLGDLAFTVWQRVDPRSTLKLAVVAASLADLEQKLTSALEALRRPDGSPVDDARGIYFTGEPLGRDGKVAFLFPGQGSQYVDMLRELSIHFHEVRQQFELADRALADRLPDRLSSYVYPPPRFTPQEQQDRQRALMQTNVAQPALGATSMGLLHLLHSLGLRPDLTAGHSYGEYPALCTAGVIDEETLYALSEARGRCIVDTTGTEPGTMAAVMEHAARVSEVVAPVEGIWIANINSPLQTVISGTQQGIDQAIERLEASGIQVRRIPVACGFHSPLMAPAQDLLAAALSAVEFRVPRLAVFSNTSGDAYPADPQAIASILAEHLVRPVRFGDEVEAMYQVGARVFVEVGPGNVLTNLTRQTLGDRPYLALPADVSGRSGLLQLQHLLGQLAVHGVSVQLDRLFVGRGLRRLDLGNLRAATREQELPPTTWLVNGGGARPIGEPVAPRAPALRLDGTRSPDHRLDGRAALPAAVASQPPAEVAAHVVDPAGPLERLDATDQPPAITTVRTPVATGPGSSVPTAEQGPIVLQFQRLMGRFLETQQQVMLSYLQGRAGGVVARGGISEVLPVPPAVESPPSAVTGTPSSGHGSAAATAAFGTQDPGVVTDAVQPNGLEERTALPHPARAGDARSMSQDLLRIVSERTGYPPEVLDLDLDVEADLGIDSIKRVEILGTLLQTRFPDQQLPREIMEQLTGIKTLRGILQSIDAHVQPPPSAVTGTPSSGHGHAWAEQLDKERHADPQVEIPRFLLRAVDLPMVTRPLKLPADATIIVTDDEGGVARRMVEALRQRGGRAISVRNSDGYGELDADAYAADLTDPTAVGELIELVRQRHGPVAGIIHLLPLRAAPAIEEATSWPERLGPEIKGLYLLARAAAPDLKARRGWVVGATSMAAFGSDPVSADPLSPSQGGIAGFVKTLALEWPEVEAKAIDFDPATAPSTLIDLLLAEMAAGDGEVEVGYQGLRRFALRPYPAELCSDGPMQMAINPNWVIMVTGGARGITAEIARELASRYQPTLVLVGRSALPMLEEAPETAGLTSPRELKLVLMEQLRQAGKASAPAQVEAAYARLLHDRDIRSNLAAMREAGATIDYVQTDVCNAPAFARVIDEVYQRYGRLDGVIHGAGVIEDKLIDDKVPDSFNRVFDTKVSSAVTLSRTLRSDLKFLVFFSSVAGRFGNRGQADYAAANEVMNKLAVDLDRRWPGRVVSLIWGPWNTGMASPEVQKRFAEMGVQLVPPDAGRRVFIQELERGVKGECEVILGGGPWERGGVSTRPAHQERFPLLAGLSVSSHRPGEIEVVRDLDLARDRYLQDHRLDGRPVLPAAMAMELMVEVAGQGWPELGVVGVDSLRVLKGIVLADGRQQRIHVRARPAPPPSTQEGERTMEVTITDPLDGTTRYRATVLLGSLPPPPPADGPALIDPCPFPMTVEEAYERLLFHGPFFAGITAIDGMSDDGIDATLRSSSPYHGVQTSPTARWLVDPVVIDSAFQLAILWCRLRLDMTPLPAGFRRFRRFAPFPESPIRCEVRTQVSADGHILETQNLFRDGSGRMIALLEGMEFGCSRSLNRLAGSWVSEGTR
jgi:acyl transferase domain-containing protein/NAD(P)-dependent dehydrogenase (short-subunit alcohol dehydrogenase family)/NAD(P)H-dependent flavin oxidoreductase YrpB (nitropropane dioxygenase family)